LYLPSKASPEMLHNYYQTKSEIKLYVRRVLVADSFEDLLPRYLNFVRGVVDSDDLPLNVSREQLQQNKIMKVISKKIVRKILELMKTLAKKDDKSEDDEEEDGEKKEDKSEDDEDEDSSYSKFYKEFSKNLKLGCQEDDANRSKVSKLLRYKTTKTSGDKEVSLETYMGRMKENQESIYYMSGESVEVMEISPNLQIFKKKDLEVLMLSDPLDEGCIQRLADFEGKKFVSIQKADLKLEETDEEKKRFKKLTDMYKPLTKWWKTLCEDLAKGTMKGSGIQIGDVEVSRRLTDSPLTVVGSKFGYSAQQEKIMKAQAFNQYDSMMAGKKTIEINPNHPVIADLLQKVKDDEHDEKAKGTAEVLFQTALIEQGFDLPNPTHLVSRVYGLMSKELGVDPDAPIKEIELPEDEEEEEEEEKEDSEDGAEKKDKHEEL